MVSEFRVGVISSTHGIRGEVTVVTKRERRILKIEKVRFFKQFVIVKFKGIDDINEIEPYKGAELWIDRSQAVSLEEGEYFIADLVGLAVMTDEGEKLGTLREVIQTGANDVYHVAFPDGRVQLVPAIPQVVLDIDLEGGVMLIRPLEGLFQ